MNLFSCKNGKGLEVDLSILEQHLKALGVKVRFVPFKRAIHAKEAGVNIFFERLCPEAFSKASRNWFIPNPEWFIHDLALLDGVDLILCRTKEVERIFKNLGKKTYFLGFTSPDCFNPKIKKDYRRFLHLAGSSKHKGTDLLLQAWEKELPPLTIVRHIPRPNCPENIVWVHKRVRTKKLREIQNQCGTHLCLSETEGFGHSLMEGLSTGAILITTDAPPMNTFAGRFTVPYTHCNPLRLATCYFADPKGILERVGQLCHLSTKELEMLGCQNRALYLEKTAEFKNNLRNLLC